MLMLLREKEDSIFLYKSESGYLCLIGPKQILVLEKVFVLKFLFQNSTRNC